MTMSNDKDESVAIDATVAEAAKPDLAELLKRRTGLKAELAKAIEVCRTAQEALYPLERRVGTLQAELDACEQACLAGMGG